MSWKIVVFMTGEEPDSEQDVAEIETRVSDALQAAGIEYDDVAVQ